MQPTGISPSLIRFLTTSAPDVMTELFAPGRILEADVVSVFQDRAVLSFGRGVRLEVALQTPLQEGQRVRVQVQPQEAAGQPRVQQAVPQGQLPQRGQGVPQPLPPGQQQPLPPGQQQPLLPGQRQPLPPGQPQPLPPGQPQPLPAGQPQPLPAGQPQPLPPGQQQPLPLGQPQPLPTGQPQPLPAGQQQPLPAGQPQPLPAGQQPPLPTAQPQPQALLPGQPQPLPPSQQRPVPAQQQPGPRQTPIDPAPRQAAPIVLKVIGQAPPRSAAAPLPVQPDAAQPSAATRTVAASASAAARDLTGPAQPAPVSTQQPSQQPGAPQVLWLPIPLPDGAQGWAQIHIQEDDSPKAQAARGGPVQQVRIWWETPALGPVQVNLEAGASSLAALFTATAADSKGAMEESLPTLQRRFAELGFPDARLGCRSVPPGETVEPARIEGANRLDKRL